MAQVRYLDLIEYIFNVFLYNTRAVLIVEFQVRASKLGVWMNMNIATSIFANFLNWLSAGPQRIVYLQLAKLIYCLTLKNMRAVL